MADDDTETTEDETAEALDVAGPATAGTVQAEAEATTPAAGEADAQRGGPATAAAVETTRPAAAEGHVPQDRHNGRKVREGIVSSAAMDKTVVVTVTSRVRHPLYRKTLQRTTKLYAQDDTNDCRVGDRVRVAETRPLSKLKRWRLLEIVERAK